MVGRSPFDDFFDEIDRFFARFFEIGPAGRKTVRYRGPGAVELSMEGNIPVAVVDARDYVKILALLPGLEKKDISVEVVGNTIEITTKKKELPILESEKVIYSEIPVNQELYKRITVPYDLDPDSVKASYENGLLVIIANKTKKSKGRRIEIE